MLNKLHRKLALFNGFILILFVIAVVCIIWEVADKGMINFWDKNLKSIASHTNDLSKIPPLPDYVKEDPIKKNPDYVKVILRDSTMKAVSLSSGGEQVEIKTRPMARQVWEKNIESWDSIESDHQYIRVYTVPFHKNNQQGIVQTSIDLHVIRDMMATFMTHLLFTALAFAIIAALIGWYLAGKALIPVRKSWQQQEEFVANAAHELRTPLTVIQTNLDVVFSSPESQVADNTKWLDNAYTETEHMGKLINDLLFLAQIDASEIQLEYNNFDLSYLMREICQEIEPVADKHGLYFNRDIDQNLFMRGDQGRIRQLLMILLDNAIKYTASGGIIGLKALKSKDKIEIQVSDSGIGIHKEDRERIFDRFYRVDKARSRTLSGTGLGLSIAQWIIKSHRGSILVQSEPGRGSTFTVILPVE